MQGYVATGLHMATLGTTTMVPVTKTLNNAWSKLNAGVFVPVSINAVSRRGVDGRCSNGRRGHDHHKFTHNADLSTLLRLSTLESHWDVISILARN
jgi:hypothetical protein